MQAQIKVKQLLSSFCFIWFTHVVNNSYCLISSKQSGMFTKHFGSTCSPSDRKNSCAFLKKSEVSSVQLFLGTLACCSLTSHSTNNYNVCSYKYGHNSRLIDITRLLCTHGHLSPAQLPYVHQH